MIDTNWTDEEKVLYALYRHSVIISDADEKILSSKQIAHYHITFTFNEKEVLKILHKLKDEGKVGYHKSMVYSDYDCKYHPIQGWYCTRNVVEKIYDVALDDETKVFTEIYGDEVNTYEKNRRFLDWYRSKEWGKEEENE